MRAARYDAFTRAFEHVASEIDRIYKELTRSGVHPVGGQAYLSLESADEPFLHGVKFTAMPPTKRFRCVCGGGGGVGGEGAGGAPASTHKHTHPVLAPGTWSS